MLLSVCTAVFFIYFLNYGDDWEPSDNAWHKAKGQSEQGLQVLGKEESGKFWSLLPGN